MFEVSDALKELKTFNLNRIYMNPSIKKHQDIIRSLFELLFNKYLADLKSQKSESVVFKNFLKDMSAEYLENHKDEEIVRDFIAGMTDRYFLRQCPANMRPKPIVK